MQGNREVGSRPLLLDLIPHEGEWVARDRGGGENGYEVEEEEKLELKLGLPGCEDWTLTSRGKRVADPSARSVALFPFKNLSSHCAGAKRGYVDTLQSGPRGYRPSQKNAFLPYRLSTGELDGAKVDEEKEMCSNGDAAVGSNSSPSRNGAAPVVGWPPIRSFRKNLANSSFAKLSAASRSGLAEEKLEKAVGCTKSMLVKINMDGIPIGRKVDLVAYSSYEKLSDAVGELFIGLLAAQKEVAVGGNHVTNAGITGLLDGTGEYTLVYEDNEGDRMLVGDVPWDMFISTVKRLRVLKTSDLMSLSLGIALNRRSTEGVASKN